MADLKTANDRRWNAMVVNSNAIIGLDRVARRLVVAKDTYFKVSAKTGVPWPVIAVIHEREASQRWNANLAQGDPWNRRSVHIPRGQGPFSSWEAAAINALKNSPPYIARNEDWSIGNTLAKLEEYNGLGYYRRGKPSPYIWSKTNQYKMGKYIADGVYSPTTVDSQNGCAALLARMMKLDPSINDGFRWSPNTIKLTSEVPKTSETPSKAAAPVAAASVVLGGALLATQAPPGQHWGWYIFGTLGVALAAWIGIRVYKQWK
jgi:lysozyme family protein